MDNMKVMSRLWWETQWSRDSLMLYYGNVHFYSVAKVEKHHMQGKVESEGAAVSGVDDVMCSPLIVLQH